MKYSNSIIINSPIGKQAADSSGSPVGVVRMDVEKSYAGVNKHLQDYINHSDKKTWQIIKAKIDYTYEKLDLALAPLERETSFSKEIKSRLERGQKILFKPNLVMPSCIDPQTHGPDRGSTTCTEWPFIAALMRWFHDKLGISYYRMSLGEAATAMTSTASMYSLLNPSGRKVTTEAVIEGRSGDFYGGWGFYFVRQYLAESLESDATDDPMQGYQESVNGIYVPPGRASDKLMVYDLNRIYDDTTKGREVGVPDGVNYKSIILHKVVVGGNPDDHKDLETYPGCILVNVPKLKVHSLTLFTNAIKNLGIGLYPMEASKAGHYKWDYSRPHGPVPGVKGGIPHEVWVPEMEAGSDIPKKDRDGNYVVKKTGGISATMIDIIKAVNNQGIFTLHVTDAIESINLDHTGQLPGRKEPEGLVFAGLDPVAADLLCARYMFTNVPLEEAVRVGLEDGCGGLFAQKVPLPKVEGTQIMTETGYDSPISRDRCFERAEQRGLGLRKYYVLGMDSLSNLPIISLKGHLGTLKNGTFGDLITKAFYFDVYKIIWDLQKTSYNYLSAVDKLTGSSLKNSVLAAFSDNGAGVITYEEQGKKGLISSRINYLGESMSRAGTEKLGFLRYPFIYQAKMLKSSDSTWNPPGHILLKEYSFGPTCLAALRLSQTETEAPDPFVPGLICGKGKWPSFQLAWYIFVGASLYGAQFPHKIDLNSLYGRAFRYADLTQNDGGYAGHLRNEPAPEAIDRYLLDVSKGKGQALDFTLYVPNGYNKVDGSPVPNVVATADPSKILTASFADGQELW